MGPSDVMRWAVGKILKLSSKIQSGVSDSRNYQTGTALFIPFQNLVEEQKWWGGRERKWVEERKKINKLQKYQESGYVRRRSFSV